MLRLPSLLTTALIPAFVLMATTAWWSPFAISVTGNGQEIASGSTTLAENDHTYFGLLPLGDSASRTYSIANNGADAITDVVVSIGGRDADHFAVTAPPTSSIAAGESADFTVAYTAPGTEGLHRATVSIASSAGAYSFDIGGIADNGFEPCAECYGIPASDPTVCSGSGTCTGADTCACNDYFFGSRCDVEGNFASGRKLTIPNFTFNFRTFLGPSLPDTGAVYSWTLRIDQAGWLRPEGYSFGVVSAPLSDTTHLIGQYSNEWGLMLGTGELFSFGSKRDYTEKFGVGDEIRMVLDRRANTLDYYAKRSGESSFTRIGTSVAFTDVIPASGRDLAVGASGKCLSSCSISFVP